MAYAIKRETEISGIPLPDCGAILNLNSSPCKGKTVNRP